MATTTDPFNDITTQYGGAIKSLYDNLKTALAASGAEGLTRAQQSAASLNDALSKTQADTGNMFNTDIAAQQAQATRLGTQDPTTSALTTLRDRILGLGNVVQGAAVDRNKYLGGIQGDYMNRLADSAQTTGATRQADLLSGIGKIRADLESKLAQQAAANAAARRSGGGGGGSGSSGGRGTQTTTVNTTAGEAFGKLDQGTQQYLKDAMAAYSGSDYVQKLTEQNAANQAHVNYYGPQSTGQTSTAAAEYRAANTDPLWSQQINYYNNARSYWDALNKLIGSPQTSNTLSNTIYG